LPSNPARAVRGLVLLLAVSACTQTGANRGEDGYAAGPSAAELGPIPQFTAEYKAPFRPFTRCVGRVLAYKLTVKVAYQEAGQLARLSAFETKLDGRFVYELALRQKPDGAVLAELRVGAFSKLRNSSGEVRRALERCEKEITEYRDRQYRDSLLIHDQPLADRI